MVRVARPSPVAAFKAVKNAAELKAMRAAHVRVRGAARGVAGHGLDASRSGGVAFSSVCGTALLPSAARRGLEQWVPGLDGNVKHTTHRIDVAASGALTKPSA